MYDRLIPIEALMSSDFGEDARRSGAGERNGPSVLRWRADL